MLISNCDVSFQVSNDRTSLTSLVDPMTAFSYCMEERRLRVFENRVLRRVFGPKRDEVTGNGENYIMGSLVICTPYPMLCGW